MRGASLRVGNMVWVVWTAAGREWVQRGPLEQMGVPYE